MKKIIYILGIIALLLVFSNCDNKQEIINIREASSTESEKNDIDLWIAKYLTDTLNISVSYKAEPFNNLYFPNNSIAESNLVLEAVKCLKSIWLDSFNTYKSPDFTKIIAPRQIMVLGAPNYNKRKVELISTKLGGVVAPIFNINQFDPKKVESVYTLCRQYGYSFAKSLLEHRPADLGMFAKLNINEYYDWTAEGATQGLYSERSSLQRDFGFFSVGARGSVLDDFCESFSILMCKTPNEIKALVYPPDEYTYQTDGQKVLEKKLIFIDKYLKDNFDINRKIFLNREISNAINKYPNSIK